MTIVFSHFPRERIAIVESAVSARSSEFAGLTPDAREGLATTAILAASGYDPAATERWLRALDELEQDPWSFIHERVRDPAWSRYYRGPSPGAWVRNVVDAYARLATAQVALGRCTEETPHTHFAIAPVSADLLDQVTSAAETLLRSARQRVTEYASVVTDDRSRRDWRRAAEDEVFEEARGRGLAERAASRVAVLLIEHASRGQPSLGEERLMKRAEATRKRARRR